MKEGKTNCISKSNLCYTYVKKIYLRARKPFSGQGYTLGSPAPPVIGAPRAEDQQVNEQHARAELGLDTSRPTTKYVI